ncbi:6-pyruvoyl trahydropterin synthase family protein [Aureibacter tunicatorum]|uniref:6-carboxy-5,6,7,8-tetrahydropterin synthase n=1 Tax=Aureibacter tunicatorum TaxID=866807 RepID=A0AAE3XPT8_9BACT|nr:6-carboxytetrahydropterin synthase [Aureibacter tunicatorum]MDR6240917.1 6-pyruvoyltetrahydropterin/6-carboxytetrahydropterin synthase [Aureibacter tunicatorum]BDD03697.1 6-carboxy-5,6,7,8-tetrahydropterin synthase [Aureibacter tunicatorum]
MKATVYRREHFNAAHRLFNANWEDQKNQEVFGKCSNQYFHGHNYEIEVAVTGEIDPDTGFVISIDELKKYIKEEITEPFDHKNLNIEVEEFKKLIPTAENIAKVSYDRLRKRINSKYELYVMIFETPRNYVKYPG